jgi:hypothetical protein
VRLVRHYWRLGKAARRFFWRILGRAIRQAPRCSRQVVQFLGMYKHFTEVHGRDAAWDPWRTPAPQTTEVPPG